MCEICIKIFNKSENRGIARKSRGGWQFFFLQGGRAGCLEGAGKTLLYRGSEPLGVNRKSRGAETQLDSMVR